MNISSFKSSFLKNLSAVPGWRSSRKLVLLESDDWGSIRMPSVKVFEELKINGIDLQADAGFRFNKYDSLATSEDLLLLFDVLSSVHDSKGKPAVMTPVAVVANPDFSKIEKSGFTEYSYEPFSETLRKYDGHDNTFATWKKGMERGLFMPQFHGREHLNVRAWMKALKAGHPLTHIAFQHGMWGISTANDPDINLEFQAAFDFIDPADLAFHKEIIQSGLDLFERMFGYRATYFVPPNGPFSSSLQHTCTNAGIKYIATSKIQEEPVGNGKTRKLFRIPGRNRDGLIYTVRNCFFEPGDKSTDWIASCLHDVSTAFRWHKPAIISSHRVNYIGRLYPENRENSLKQLKSLLQQIVKYWPDCEFLTSEQLGALMNE